MTSQEICGNIIENIQKVIIGKNDAVEIALASLISGGHILLNDVPGTGKTTLAKVLAKSIDLDFKRIQFTPDLLPGDLTGINVFNPKTVEFSFRKGAMFTNLLLADEINRATPRTQSALLEAMEEKQITLDGNTYCLDPPYFVIATQNPVEAVGTFPLPEAQLDRFMVRLSLGYPTSEESVLMLSEKNNINDIKPVASKNDVLKCMEDAEKVYASPDILKYIVDIGEETRCHHQIALGLSSRGMISLLKLCKGYALIKGYNFVTPEFVKKMAVYAIAHRIILKSKASFDDEINIVKAILDKTPVPTENFRA